MKRRWFPLMATIIMLVTACASSPGERAAELAYSSYTKGHYSHSLPAAQLLIAEEPDNPMGYSIAGDSLVRLKRYKDAEAYFVELINVLDRQPDPLAMRAERAATEFKLERVREQRAWTRKELQLGTIQRLRDQAQPQKETGMTETNED